MIVFGKEKLFQKKLIQIHDMILFRSLIKNLFEQAGLDDSFGHFYNEMDSWKLWELDPNQSRRTGINTLSYEWLRQYVSFFCWSNDYIRQ